MEIGRLQNYHIYGVTSVAFSPVAGERLVATGSFDNTVGLFEITPQQPLSEVLFNVPGEILSVSNLPSGAILLVERRNGSLYIWDFSQDQESPLHSLSTSAASAAFSPDGSLLALGQPDGMISLVEVASGEILRSFSASDNPVLALAFSPDGRTLVSSQCVELDFVDRGNNPHCKNHDVLFWDYISGEVINTLEVDQDQDSPAVVQDSNVTGHTDNIRALAIDPSGNFLATGSDDKTIILWDIQSKLPGAVPLKRHSAAVTSLAFSPDSTTLASAGEDRKLLLWDTRTFQSIGNGLLGSPAVATGLGFSPDNKKLLAGDISGTLTGWDVDIESWVARNCELAERNLSDSEWRQFFPDQPGGNRPTCSGNN
jgi:WD40 repeat protein